MNTKSCFFIGHRSTDQSILPALVSAVERHVVEYEVTDFFVGNYGSFDSMAAHAVQIVKERHPEIRLTLVLPYHPAIRPIEKPAGFDSTYYPWEDENIPKRLAIVKTNRRMVETCNYLIANAWHHLGGSGDIVDYARKREEKVAIAWSGSLNFTVERSGKSLIGSAASGEGLVNVYRGTGKVLLAPVTQGAV